MIEINIYIKELPLKDEDDIEDLHSCSDDYSLPFYKSNM